MMTFATDNESEADELVRRIRRLSIRALSGGCTSATLARHCLDAIELQRDRLDHLTPSERDRVLAALDVAEIAVRERAEAA